MVGLKVLGMLVSPCDVGEKPTGSALLYVFNVINVCFMYSSRYMCLVFKISESGVPTGLSRSALSTHPLIFYGYG